MIAATRRCFVAGLLLALVSPVFAQRRAGAIDVLVTADHADWKYTSGQPVTFVISPVRDGRLVSGLSLSYTIGPEQMPPTTTGTVVSAAEPVEVKGGTMNQPGFLRCTVIVTDAGRTYRGLATAAFDPGKIEPAVKDPQGFDAFWQAGKDELAQIPIDAQRFLMPELSTSKVNVYQVRLQNVGRTPNSRTFIFGMLAEPKAPGRYPALLNVPGAGVWKINPLIKEAEAGAITLAIGIHGIPLNLDAGVYPILAQGALNGYWLWGIESRDKYYYRRVYLGCVRANDYLTSLTNWDGRTLAVTGESQGGALTIVTAALDPRVKALAPVYPALSDLTAYLNGRAGGWPHMFKDEAMRTPANLETAPFYDVVNFARRIRVPGLYTFGYNDETCPPSSMYAAYNAVTAPRKLLLALQMGHRRIPEVNDVIDAWLAKYLATGQAPEIE